MRPARTRQKDKNTPSLYLVQNKPSARVVRVKRKTPRWVKMILAGLALYLLFLFGKGGYELWNLKGQIEDLKLEQSRLMEEQQKLKQELESLNDPEVIEKIARESLGMVRRGETVVLPAIPGYNIPKPEAVAPGEITH